MDRALARKTFRARRLSQDLNCRWAASQAAQADASAIAARRTRMLAVLAERAERARGVVRMKGMISSCPVS